MLGMSKSSSVTTIFDAAVVNDYSTVRYFLSYSSNDANERNEDGLTCLHLCASLGNLETAKVLIDFGADLSIKDYVSEWTALHRAIYLNHPKMVLLLVNSGATLDFDNYDSVGDKERLSPLSLLSLQLQKELQLSRKKIDAGTLISFGRADFTLGVPLPKSSETAGPRKLEGLMMDSIAHMSASKYHAIGVTKNGQLYSWGHGRCGRLGHGNEFSLPEPMLIQSLAAVKVRYIATAENHTLALSETGDVYSWGSDRLGQLGHGNNDANRIMTSPKRIEALRKENIIGIAAGDSHSLCFTANGEVLAWGSNKYGQLGLRVSETSTGFAGVCNSPVPKRISMPFITKATKPKYTSSLQVQHIVQIIAAYNSSLLLVRLPHTNEFSRFPGYQTDIYQWGDGVFTPRKINIMQYYRNNNNNNNNQRPRSQSNDFISTIPEEQLSTVLDSNRIVQIAAGKHHFVGVSNLGYVYTWGSGVEQLGHGISEKQHSLLYPTLVEALLPENGGGKIIEVAAGGNRTYAVSEQGDLYTWGATEEKGILTPGMSVYQPTAKRIRGIKRAIQVAAAEDYTLVLMSPSVPALPILPNHGLPDTTSLLSMSKNKKQKDKQDDSDEDDDEEGSESPLSMSLSSHHQHNVDQIQDELNGDLETMESHFEVLHNMEEQPMGGQRKESISSSAKEDKVTMDVSPPTLKDLSQYALCKQVNIKNILASLCFSDKFDGKILQSYCEEFLERNLDIILVQSRPSDIERYVEDVLISSWSKHVISSGIKEENMSLSRRRRTMSYDPSATTSTRKLSFDEENSSKQQLLSNKPPQITIQSRKVFDKPVATTTILTEKKNYKDVENSIELLKLIRAIKKKLQSIDELQKKIIEEEYTPTKDQQDKISKRSELLAELSKMEQYLVRLQVREQREPQESSASVPEELPDEKQQVAMGFEKSSLLDEITTMQPVKANNSNEKVNKLTPAAETIKSAEKSKTIWDQKKKKKKDVIQLNELINDTILKASETFTNDGAIPSFLQWNTMVQGNGNKARSASVTSHGEVEENDNDDSDNIGWQTSHSNQKISLSSMLPNGRTVLSPANAPSRPPAPAPASNVILPPRNLATSEPYPLQPPPITTSSPPSNKPIGRNTFDLSDFLTAKTPPAKQQQPTPALFTTTPSPAAKSAWGTPSSSNTTTIAAKPSSSSSPPLMSPAAPVPASTVKFNKSKSAQKLSFAEIQAQEELARQQSNMMQLKGNEIPWHVDRKPRGASLETLMQQELAAKAEEEFIQQELAKFAILEEQERLLQQVQKNKQQQLEKDKKRKKEKEQLSKGKTNANPDNQQLASDTKLEEDHESKIGKKFRKNSESKGANETSLNNSNKIDNGAEQMHPHHQRSNSTTADKAPPKQQQQHNRTRRSDTEPNMSKKVVNNPQQQQGEGEMTAVAVATTDNAQQSSRSQQEQERQQRGNQKHNNSQHHHKQQQPQQNHTRRKVSSSGVEESINIASSPAIAMKV